VGSWFNRKYPQLARLQYSRQRLPSLDQVLQLFAEQARPHSLMYLEMKTVRSRRANEELARAVVRELESHGLKQRAVVIGFNLFAVAKVKEVDPSLRTGALFGPRQRTTRSIRKMIDATLFVGAQEILFQRLLARPRALAAAREKGLLPVVWTVDDPKWMRQHSGLGIHAIITNHPARMAKASS
jgi:glycerophosphoryl diester phosphodiesterase